MKKNLMLSFIMFIVFGCEKDDLVPKGLLKDSIIEYLTYTDIHQFPSNNLLSPPCYCVPMETRIIFEYEGQKLTRVKGSFINVPDVTLMYKPQFSADAYDSIVHLENDVFVYTRPPYAFYSNENPENPIQYEFDANQKLVGITSRNGVRLTYEYDENIIIERMNSDRVLRKFYMENNNLVKVESENINLEGELVGRKEIIFSDYDNNPNPFKGLYYITGAFYRSFSENNYSKMTLTKYSKHEDEFIVSLEFKKEFGFDYTNSGYPKFGNY